MDVSAGAICLVPFPFTDQAVAKLRPVLVADSDNPVFLALTDGANGPAGQHVSFIQITSRENPGLYNIIVDPSLPAYEGTGLAVLSTIRCWNIQTIHKAFIGRILGSAPPELMAEVRERLKLRLRLD